MPKAISPIPEAQKAFHDHSGSHHHSADCHARLGSLADAPAWMRQPFVLSGYRLYYSLSDTIRSICGLHNETGMCLSKTVMPLPKPSSFSDPFSSQHLDAFRPCLGFHLERPNCFVSGLHGRASDDRSTGKSPIPFLRGRHFGRFYSVPHVQLRELGRPQAHAHDRLLGNFRPYHGIDLVRGLWRPFFPLPYFSLTLSSSGLSCTTPSIACPRHG